MSGQTVCVDRENRTVKSSMGLPGGPWPSRSGSCTELGGGGKEGKAYWRLPTLQKEKGVALGIATSGTPGAVKGELAVLASGKEVPTRGSPDLADGAEMGDCGAPSRGRGNRSS